MTGVAMDVVDIASLGFGAALGQVSTLTGGALGLGALGTLSLGAVILKGL
jgi:hypothetical protein